MNVRSLLWAAPGLLTLLCACGTTPSRQPGGDTGEADTADTVEDTEPGDTSVDTRPDTVEDTEPGDTSADTRPDTVEDTELDGGSVDEVLCVESGGRWDEGGCGHYRCGVPNLCEVATAGCDCGPSANFVAGFGCQVDPVCGGPTDLEALCVSTGGSWDTGGCGDYVCGVPPAILCLRPEPGCNCGTSANFDRSGAGCVRDSSCAANPREAACESSGGRWQETSCGDYRCGLPPFCDAIIPGCDCGLGRNVDPASGACAEDPGCPVVTDPQTLCTATLGAWDETSCGDYRCGQRPMCEAVIPGCNCGVGRAYFEGLGCSITATCPACPDPMAPNVHYIANSHLDPEICTRIDFNCDPGSRSFDSECGCGCIDVE
jgi:hypothetical protein